jgi:hypothetical protein
MVDALATLFPTSEMIGDFSGRAAAELGSETARDE